MSRFENNIKDRWIEKPDERVLIDFSEINEDLIDKWVANHHHVKQVQDFILPPTNDRFW